MKRYRTSCEPRPLETNWLKSDTADTWCRPHSYAKAYHCYQVVARGGIVIMEFKNSEKAKAYASCRGYSVKEIALSEEKAHEQRIIDLARARWNGGWGA